MKKLKNLKHIFAIIALSLTFLFGSIMIFSLEFQNAINGFFIYRTTGGVWQDRIYTPKLTPSSDIALITIDERTINTLQSSSDQKMLTIPKSVYATLVTKLEAAGVKGIGFDIVFQNADPEEDAFAAVMSQYSNIVIATTRYNGEDCISDEMGSGMTCPGAPRSVYAGIPWGIIDIDNIYQRAQNYDISGTPYKDWKKDTPVLRAFTAELADLTGTPVPIDGQRSALTPFFGPPGSYHKISLVDVLTMSRAELIATFGGKYILIGESGTLIHDSFISPVTTTLIDGVETHAHFLDGLLQNKMLTRVSDQTMAIVTLVLALSTILLYFFLPKYLSPILAIVVLIVILWISRYLYGSERFLVDIFPLFLAGAIITFPMTFIYRFFVVDREKRYIESAFGHYIDPKMVEMIDTEEVELSLGGEQRELSVFFSDIAGFTTISERLSPPDLFYLMSSYLSQMTDVLKRQGGTLDKYIGDAVMGFFGAPVSQSDHAKRACMTALSMRAILPEFNREITARGILPVDFRVGIATGDVLVGNIGSRDHFNYTVLGDTVNLASRLEATGKEYDVHIIIAEGTHMLVSDIFSFRELDTIAVKGKTQGINIYELLGRVGEIVDRGIYDTYERALALYRAGAYMDAGKIWESQMEIDPPSRIMALRCVEILKGNVQVENGVYHMTHK